MAATEMSRLSCPHKKKKKSGHSGIFRKFRKFRKFRTLQDPENIQDTWQFCKIHKTKKLFGWNS